MVCEKFERVLARLLLCVFQPRCAEVQPLQFVSGREEMRR